MAMYEDKFCQVGHDELKVKNCYCHWVSKTIPFCTIKSINYDKQRCDLLRMKEFGMSIKPTWWACDIQRMCGRKYHNVIVRADGCCLPIGFTARNVEKFLEAMKPSMDKGVTVSSHIP